MLENGLLILEDWIEWRLDRIPKVIVDACCYQQKQWLGHCRLCSAPGSTIRIQSGESDGDESRLLRRKEMGPSSKDVRKQEKDVRKQEVVARVLDL